MSIKNYGLITSIDELRAITEQITGNTFGFDIETGYTGAADREKGAIRPEIACLAGISFTDSTTWARYVPLGHDNADNLDNTQAAQILWDLLATGKGVAHNALFELKHLSRWFMRFLAADEKRGEQVRTSNGYFPIHSDTLVEAYLAAEFQRFGLKPLTLLMFRKNGEPADPRDYDARAALYDRIKKDYKDDERQMKAVLQQQDWHVMTELAELFPDLPKNKHKYLRFNTLPLDARTVEYACEDSVWCLAIHQHYHPKIKDRLLYPVEKAIIEEVLPAMEDEGLCYDWHLLARTSEFLHEFRDKYNAEIMAELSELAGEPIAINLASPMQVANILFDKLGYRTNVYTTKTRDLPPEQRKMSTGKIALERLAQQHPVVQKIRDWKKQTKLLTSYLDAYEKQYNYADDGRVHPSHLSCFVITGRFAHSEPNYAQCLPGSYEVLTPSGWTRLDKLDDTTPVAQYSNGQSVSFVVPSEVIRQEYDGDMVEISAGRLGTWRYTPNHRVVYRGRNSRGERYLTDIKECTAEQWVKDLAERPVTLPFGRKFHDRYIPCAGYTDSRVELPDYGRQLLSLAVAAQADGTRTNGHQYDIAVCRERKIVALRQLGLEPQKQADGRWRVRFPRELVDTWLDESKNFRAEAILKLHRDDLRFFLREVMQWDGNSKHENRYSQKASVRRASVDVVQAAAALCGHATSLWLSEKQDYVSVNVHPRPHRDSGFQAARRVPFDGMVYCVTVPSGMFLVRNEDGFVEVTGNSPKKYHYDLQEAREAHAAGVEPPPGTCFQFNFRDVIMAPPGWYIFGFDLSQAELRAIAGEAQETTLLEAFNRGDDVHRLTAALMLGVELEDVTSEQRNVGKTMNFALLYGMSTKGLADRLGIPLHEAQSLMDKYFAGLPGIAAYMSRQVEYGKVNGYVVSKFGRRLPIWEYKSENPFIYSKGDRACVNYPVQGAATGDLVKIMMVRIHRAIKNAGLADKVKMVMNVHDALEFYVHQSLQPRDVFRVLRPAIIFPIPGWPEMKADWHMARRWGSPIELEETPDGDLVEKGSQVKEEKPAIEIDEDGEEVEVLPEVDPAVLQALVAEDGRVIVLTLEVMPSETAWARFISAVRSSPGANQIHVVTPDGDVTLPYATSLRPDHIDRVSSILGGARMTYAAEAERV